MSAASIAPLYLEQEAWRRFAVLVSPPDGVARRPGSLVFLPAFAEEMNKSRRMVAMGARALATRGWTVLLLDPLGCGDSPGEFEDATWEAWLEDVTRAHSWLSHRSEAPVGLWAMRAGALLAAAALPRVGSVPQVLLWQPVQSGKTQLQQFLRLKVASAAIAGGAGKTNTKALLETLQAGQPVEVAGYTLGPELALPMQQAELGPRLATDSATWLEVAAWDPPVLAPASGSRVEAWRAAGTHVSAEAVRGPSFWLTQEIEECLALIEATIRLLENP